MEVLDLRWNDAGTGAITLRFRTAAPARAEWQWQPALSYGPVPDSRDSERLVLGPALVYEHGGAEDTPRTEHTVTLGGLLPGESYYVRVRAARRGPEGAWREVVVTPQVPEPVPAPSGEPLKEWLLDLAARQAARQAEERRAVEGPATLAAYQARVREALQAGLGGLPERTPLCPRILGRLDRGDYSIENVVFEALPGFYVPGNLYLPREAAGPLPAVLGVCGHAVAAKSEPQIVQMTNVNLVRKGYVVLQIDAPGQNEMGWDGSA